MLQRNKKMSARAVAYKACYIGIGSCLCVFVLIGLAAGLSQFEGTAFSIWIRKIYAGGYLPSWLAIALNDFGQSLFYTRYAIPLMGGAASAQSWRDAEAYYRMQQPIFMKAAADWQLARPFTTSSSFMTDSMTWYGALTARAQGLAQNFLVHGMDDYRIEKDKCAMHNFLVNNGFPASTALRIWSQYDAEIYAAELQTVVEQQQSWPLVYKLCHISMGHYNAAWVVENKLAAQAETTANRIAGLWQLRPSDRTRSWGTTFDPLTKAVPPGLMIELPFSEALEPAEIKVEVFWGRAYLALVDTSGYAFGKCSEEGAILLRDSKEFVHYRGATWIPHREPCSQWLVDEGHMPYIWSLAEGFAKAASIDAIRVDVFVWPGHPERASINEISLTSGAMYRWHFEFMAAIWTEAHLKRSYKVVDHGKSIIDVNRGKDWYAVHYANCNKDVLSRKLYAEFCASDKDVLSPNLY